MRQLIWLDSAVNDVVRLREFIAAKNTNAARKAAEALIRAVDMLIDTPNIGKPVIDLPEYRDLYFRFGAAGYVIRYKIYYDDIYIVYIRHYHESGFNTK